MCKDIFESDEFKRAVIARSWAIPDVGTEPDEETVDKVQWEGEVNWNTEYPRGCFMRFTPTW